MKKLFSLLTAILFVGTMWATDINDTIAMIGYAGSSANSYQNITVAGSSAKDVGMVAYAYNPTSGQIRGGKTTIAGAEITTADNSKNWSLYNSEAMPGAIKAIKVIQTGTGDNKFQNHLYVSLGTSSQGDTTSVTYAQAQTSLTKTQINFTIDATKGYTYFKLLSNEKFTAGSVTGVEVIVTYEESEDVIVKTLESIAITGMTTEYEQNEAFSFDGTCTATYSVTKNGVPQPNEVKNVTPTSVTEPNFSTTGEKEITVTYTFNEISKTAKYNINVITPYSRSSLVFGDECKGEGTADDGLEWIVSSDAKESTYEEARGIHYGTGSASVSYIQLSSEAFYKNIKKFEVEVAGNNSPSLAITVGGAMFGDSAKNITNSNTKYIFKPTNEQSGTDFYGEIVVRLAKTSKQNGALYVKSVIVKYENFAPQVLTIAACENGSVGATVGGDAVSSGAEVPVGTTVELSNTPASNYKLSSYDVYKTGESTTKVTVTNGAFLMPPYPVTISATFSNATALEDVETSVKAVKVLRNGVLYIEKAGKTYNAQGQLVK